MPLPLLTTPISGAYYAQSRADVLTVLSVTTGAADCVVTLGPAALTYDGDEQTIRKADAGAANGALTSRVIVQDSTGATLAWLITQGDVVRVRSDGTAWFVVYHALSPWRQLFNAITSTGCVVPPLFTSVDVNLIGGGRGGNAGQRAATTVYKYSSGGGNSGPGVTRHFNAATILALYPSGAAIPIGVGAGGLGAAGATSDNTTVVAGSVGGSSSFGTLLDTASSPAGISSAYCGAGASTTAVPGNSTASVAGVNGSAPAEVSSSGFTQAQTGYGLGGTTSGTAPTAGFLGTARPDGGGGGGGSGAYISGQAGQNGGAGGFPGGGGGGGSASDNGFTSGAGGNGAAGRSIVTWNFGE